MRLLRFPTADFRQSDQASNIARKHVKNRLEWRESRRKNRTNTCPQEDFIGLNLARYKT